MIQTKIVINLINYLNNYRIQYLQEAELLQNKFYTAVLNSNYHLMTISPQMTVVALMNSMIGGTILILPLLVIYAGIVPTLISIGIMGLTNLLSCTICVDHLGKDKDLHQTLCRHSNGRKVFKNIYNLFVFPGNLAICMVYFQLICIQWQLILNSASKIIPIMNAVAILLLIVILKYYNFGTKLLGYGIISIITYLIFLCWVLESKPTGSNQIPVWTWNFNQIFNAFSTAFSIQGVFIPVLRKCQQQHKYTKILVWTFILGGLVYTFISFSGAYGNICIILGILNRIPYIQNAQTIEQYFSNKDWPVMVIAVIYLVHLYTALPEYLVIGISRLLNVFGIQNRQNKVFTYQQLIAIILGIVFCLITSVFDIKLSLLLAINGSLVAFFVNFIFPTYIHIRCYYFSHGIKSSTQLIQMNNVGTGDNFKNQGQMRQNENDLEESKKNSDVVTANSDKQVQSINFESEDKDCIKTQNQCKRKLWLGINLALITFGFFVFGYTLYILATS